MIVTQLTLNRPGWARSFPKLMDTCLYPNERCGDARFVTGEVTSAIASRKGLNLRRWVDLPTLLCWIEEEIERFVPLSLGQTFVAPNAADRFRRMMTILSFGYSTGITRTAEIVDACRQESTFRNVVGSFFPFPEELRSFRRRYRAVLEVVLTRLFMRAALSNAEFAREAVPRELENQFENRAREVLNVARHLDACDDC